jgi:hypothetical protein
MKYTERAPSASVPFTSATSVNDVAEHSDGRTLIGLYVGDLDPSGMFMSECDLPQRLAGSATSDAVPQAC